MGPRAAPEGAAEGAAQEGAAAEGAAPQGAPAGVRLFLALDLPPDARAALARWRDPLVAGHDGLRPVADSALHVTLVFFGRRPRAQVERIWQTAAGSLAGRPPPTLAATGFQTVPTRRPRVLAIDLEDQGGRAAALHEALGAALAQAGLHDPEPRPLWPHVTVARVRSRGGAGTLARLPALEAPPPHATPFTARWVTLYRSDLHPAGARYAALERLELG